MRCASEVERGSRFTFFVFDFDQKSEIISPAVSKTDKFNFTEREKKSVKFNFEEFSNSSFN